MRLRVQYTAQLRTLVGRTEQDVELTEGSNLADLLLQLTSEMSPEAAGYLLAPEGGLRPSLLVVVNNQSVSTAEADAVVLHTSDVVMLLPPIAGG